VTQHRPFLASSADGAVSFDPLDRGRGKQRGD
jgi:hypothetical protein